MMTLLKKGITSEYLDAVSLNSVGSSGKQIQATNNQVSDFILHSLLPGLIYKFFQQIIAFTSLLLINKLIVNYYFIVIQALYILCDTLKSVFIINSGKKYMQNTK